MSIEYVVCCPVCDTDMEERGHADCWYCPACDARYRFEQTLVTVDDKPNYVWALLFPELCPICTEYMYVAYTHEGVDIWTCANCDESFNDEELARGKEAIHA